MPRIYPARQSGSQCTSSGTKVLSVSISIGAVSVGRRVGAEGARTVRRRCRRVRGWRGWALPERWSVVRGERRDCLLFWMQCEAVKQEEMEEMAAAAAAAAGGC